MSVAFDAKSTGTTGANSDTIVIGGSATCVVYSFLWEATSTFSTRTFTVTCGGTSMTQDENVQLQGTGVDFFGVATFYLLNPPTGSQTITITPNASANTYGGGASYTGVLSIGSFSTASNITLTASSASGNMLFNTITVSSGSITSPSLSSYNQTQRFNQTPDAQNCILIGDAAGAASVTMSATLSGSGTEHESALELSAVAPPDKTAGAQITTLIPNPFVGPQGLRINKRMPQRALWTLPYRHVDGANQTWTFTASPAQLLSNPFANVIQKMSLRNTGQVANIQAVGDSTCHGFGDTNGDGGWPSWLGIFLGIYYDVTVNYYDVSAGTGYTLVSGLGHTGSGANNNVINVWNGGINGSGLEGFGNEEYYMTNGGLLAVQFSALGNPKPDVVMVYDGINDISNGASITSAQWTAAVKTYITGVGTGNGGVPAGYPGLQHYVPGVPIIFCTQHYSWTITNFATAYYPYQSAVAAALTANGNSLPLAPAAQAGLNDVWVLDTQQAWNPTAYTQTQIMSGTGGNGDPHPNDAGYQIMAVWMLSQLAPFIGNAGYSYQPTNIASPLVGPQALRSQKRMPYETFKNLAAGNSFSDGANSSWVFGTADDGFVQPGGLMPPLQIPNPGVGPMALRQSKKWPQQVQQVLSYPPASSLTDIFASTNSNWTYSGATLGGNQIILTGTLRTTGTFDLTGSFATIEVLQIPTGAGFVAFDVGHNLAGQQLMYRVFVQSGTVVLNKYDANGNATQLLNIAFTSSMVFWRFREANGVFFFDTSQDGVSWTNRYNGAAVIRLSDVQFGFQASGGTGIIGYYNLLPSPYSYAPTQIANPFVGPQALRNQKRLPYVPFTQQAGNQSLSDGANSTWAFATADDGFVQPGGLMPPLQIPNPFVGPMALRQQKRMPYLGFQKQGFTDGANQTVTFTTSDDGFVQPGGLMPPLQIPNPFVGPQALRNAKRMPYVSSQRQGFTDGANQSIAFTTSDDGFIDHPGAKTVVVIPNPFVGPQALRNQKHMPYETFRASSGAQALSDGANSTWVFATSDDGFVQPVGLMPPLVIPNPFVGPMALRNQKRMPYVGSQQQGYTDSANLAISVNSGFPVQFPFIFTSVDGFVNTPGAMTTVVIPNPFVGPMALRQSKRMPYVSSRQQGFTDAANLTMVFVTTTDGSVPGGTYMPLIIPNPFVGPMAMRNRKRMPYVPAAHQVFSDGANSTWVFTTATNGRRGITDGANSTWVFTTSTGGVRGVRDGANVTITFTTADNGVMTSNQPLPPLLIPNPFVGPQALRNRKRMPYMPTVTLGKQTLTDGANSNWVFTTSTDGHRGITAGANTTIVFSDSPAGVRGVRDGANVTITVGRVVAGQRHIFDSANRTIIINTSTNGKTGFHDGANLHLVFATADDGFVHPFLIDVAGTVIVGPNEIRSITLPVSIFSVIVNQTNFPYQVQ